MHNYISFGAKDGIVFRDIIAFIAIIVSVSSLIFSVYLIYLTKRLEILNKQFEHLCIKNVESILFGLDKVFNNEEDQKSKNYLNQITESLVELQLFLIALRDTTYSKIDVDHFIKIMEQFTEKIYMADGSTILNYKGDYFATKLNIYRSLYQYSLEKEVRFLVFFRFVKFRSR